MHLRDRVTQLLLITRLILDDARARLRVGTATSLTCVCPLSMRQICSWRYMRNKSRKPSHLLNPRLPKPL